MELGDEIFLYDSGNKYQYIYSDGYEIKKDGYASIYVNDDIKSIILITCKEDSDDAQVVYIGYLRGEESYLREQ